VSQKLTYTFLYIISALFIAANMIFVYNDSLVLNAIPFAIILGFLAFFSLDKLLIAIMFFVPISIELSEFVPHIPLNMSLPTEPFLMLTLGMFLLKIITEKRFDKKVLAHPISIAIYVYLFWIFITSITSELPIVSFKYLLVRIWFIVCFYFLITQLVENRKNISRLIWAYTFGMMIAVTYTLIRHAAHGFDQTSANFVMFPIFRDHTSYGAALAMILPALFVLIRFTRNAFNIRFMYWVVIVFLCIGLIFSYTRAAWASLAFVAVIWLIAILKIKFRTLILVGAFSAALVLPMYNQIMYKMSENNEVSSTNLSEHVKSMSNISTDASNLERINRWKCALRMFEQRPIFGWGPGSYMFLYAPFQNSQDQTIISTNAHDNGNAHSEYLGLLAEAGIFGTLTYLAIILTTLIIGFRLFHKSKDEYVKQISLFLVLGLITYYIHSFMNDFLDMDKIASLFWVFTAIIVSFDIYEKEKLKEDGNGKI
jgi:putative inorganic carbon (hco3(-)) transporter